VTTLDLPTEDAANETAQRITRDWMTHLGYTIEQITAAEAEDHSRCEREGWNLNCTDGDGEKSLHPEYDELYNVAELVMFTLYHPSMAGLAPPVHGFDDSSILNPATGQPYPIYTGPGEPQDPPDPLCLCGAYWLDGGCADQTRRLEQAYAGNARLRQQRDEARAVIRNAHQAIRTQTTAAAVALAMFSTRDCGKPSLLDELTAALAERDAAQAADQRALDSYSELEKTSVELNRMLLAAEAERDALLPVVEAAKAWRAESTTVATTPLVVAVDTLDRVPPPTYRPNAPSRSATESTRTATTTSAATANAIPTPRRRASIARPWPAHRSAR
jgi:hypothetical protein